MVRTQKGTHGLEWAWCDGVSQNGAGHMVRTQKETHRSEWTWCAGISQNGAVHMVRTEHPPTANPNS